VMEAADAEEEQDQHQRRRGGLIQQQVDLETFLRERPGAPKLPEVTLRRNVFVQGREHWPRESAGGLTMKEIQKAPDGSWAEFAYSYEKNYDTVQTAFHRSVASGDPMNLVHLLKQNPYHISTLLQVSNVAKQDQNMALAAELCERALFTFGRLATTSFRQSLEQGRARLDFMRPENREFWLASFRYLSSLIRKGTYRTALEWAKVMFSLDPNDPYAVLHYIHSLAIKARESSWLIEFMSYLDSSTVDYRAFRYIGQSIVLAKLQLGDVEGAREDLTRGIRQLPWLYCALFQELNLDTPPSIWGISSNSDARSFWIKLYISKTKDLWNNTQALALLKTVASALSKVDTSSLPADDQPADLAAARLAYLEGDTSLLALVPQELLNSQPNYDSDPLPPAEHLNIFTSTATRLPWALVEHRDVVDRLMRQGGLAQMPPGGHPGEVGAEDESDFDDDDDELQRDIEGQAGIYGGIRQVLEMLGLRGTGIGGGAEGNNDNDGGVEPSQERRDNGNDTGSGNRQTALPGAWPEEEADADDGEAADHDQHRPGR
jgi:hypothetical protein